LTASIEKQRQNVELTPEHLNRIRIEELKQNHEKILKNQRKLNYKGGIDNKLFDQARRFIKFDTSR